MQTADQTDILSFVSETLNTFVKWDLARFFNDHPGVGALPGDVARFCGRDVEEVIEGLDDLVVQGVVTHSTRTDKAIYRLVADPALRARLSAFTNACSDPQFRLRAIQLVLRSGG